MRHFADELQSQLNHSGMSQAEFARKCGISQGQIWKWLNAEQVSITGEQIDALAAALRADPLTHAKLLAAHLHDERAGKASKLVRIEVDSPQELKDQPTPRSKGERAIRFLAEKRLLDRNVNDLVIDLARCLGADL